MRRALAYVSLTIAFIATGCGGDKAVAGPDKGALSKAQTGWEAVSSCLIGPPLAEGDKASDRLRSIDLALVAVGKGADGDWTKVCQKPVGELAAHLSTFGQDPSVAKYRALRRWLEELNSTRSSMYVASKDPIIDRVWHAARQAGFDPIAEDAKLPDPKAPPSTTPVGKDTLSKLGQTKGYTERTELAPNGGVRFILGDKVGGAFHCHIQSQKAALDSAVCAPLVDVSIAATPLSAASNKAAFYWDSQPKPQAFGLDGQPVDNTPVGASAFVFDNGTIADVLKQGRKAELIRRLPKGKLQRAPVRPPPGGQFLGFLGGALAWRGPIRGASGNRPATVESIGGGRIALRGAIEIGEIPRDAKHPMACRSKSKLYLALIGDDPHKRAREPDKRNVAILARGPKRWSKPTRIMKVPFGKPAQSWSERTWRSFTCTDEGVSLTWLRDDRRIGQILCKADACTPSVSEPVAAVAKNEKLRMAGIGDKVIVVRTVRSVAPLSGLTDVVSMRLAPVADIAGASDTVLVGDDKYGGLPNLNKAIGLVASADAAVVLVHSDDGVYGLRVDASGKIGKLSVPQ